MKSPSWLWRLSRSCGGRWWCLCCAPWGLDHAQGRQPNVLFGLTAGWWLLFTSSGSCINALLLNMSGFALLLFSLIRADDSCSPLPTISGSRASLAPLRHNKILNRGCSSCACQASSIQLSSLFNKTLHDLWLHSGQSVDWFEKWSSCGSGSSQSLTSSPFISAYIWNQCEHIRKRCLEKAHFPPGMVGAGNTWPEAKVYFP